MTEQRLGPSEGAALRERRGSNVAHKATWCGLVCGVRCVTSARYQVCQGASHATSRNITQHCSVTAVLPEVLIPRGRCGVGRGGGAGWGAGGGGRRARAQAGQGRRGGERRGRSGSVTGGRGGGAGCGAVVAAALVERSSLHCRRGAQPRHVRKWRGFCKETRHLVRTKARCRPVEARAARRRGLRLHAAQEARGGRSSGLGRRRGAGSGGPGDCAVELGAPGDERPGICMGARPGLGGQRRGAQPILESSVASR